ncbi:DNA (cytosine-5-)-methyltransferase [bacterium]|nr:DNA (cytosine-5-)-methyltransferase [bacterium]
MNDKVNNLGARNKRHYESCSSQASSASARLRFFDLFSGIGGFRLGLERAGFKCIGYCENDYHASLLYKSYFDTKQEFYIKDATEIKTSELPDFDILCAGFPCQSFSIAGKRLGFEDTRGSMFFEIIRILKDKRPRYFILENVKGLLNHDGGKTFQTILKLLSDIGYQTQWQLLNSKFFGVPQNRERVYIVGCYGKECTGKIFPISGTDKTNSNNGEKENIVYWKNSKDKWVEEERTDVGTIRTQSDLCRQPLLKQIPETSGNPQGCRIYTTDGISPCLTASHGNYSPFKVRNGTKKGYDEAVPGDGINLAFPNSNTRRGRVGKGCSQTLDTSCSIGTIDGYRLRRLTPLECFRLQGFPDDMFETTQKLKLADGHLYKMVGNAVTVNVIETVAKQLAKVINGKT